MSGHTPEPKQNCPVCNAGMDLEDVDTFNERWVCPFDNHIIWNGWT